MTIAIINFVRQDYLNVTLGGTNKNAWWLMLPVGWSLTLILVVLMVRFPLSFCRQWIDSVGPLAVDSVGHMIPSPLPFLSIHRCRHLHFDSIFFKKNDKRPL